MREMIQSSQNLLLEAKEVKMDTIKVRAQTQFSRTQLGSGQGFVLLIKIFRLIPNLGIFMITLHRTPRGRKALDYIVKLKVDADIFNFVLKLNPCVHKVKFHFPHLTLN